MGQPRPLFCLLLFFSNTDFTEKTVDVSRIRTRIVGVEGEHADRLTTPRPTKGETYRALPAANWDFCLSFAAEKLIKPRCRGTSATFADVLSTTFEVTFLS